MTKTFLYILILWIIFAPRSYGEEKGFEHTLSCEIVSGVGADYSLDKAHKLIGQKLTVSAKDSPGMAPDGVSVYLTKEPFNDDFGKFWYSFGEIMPHISPSDTENYKVSTSVSDGKYGISWLYFYKDRIDKILLPGGNSIRVFKNSVGFKQLDPWYFSEFNLNAPKDGTANRKITGIIKRINESEHRFECEPDEYDDFRKSIIDKIVETHNLSGK